MIGSGQFVIEDSTAMGDCWSPYSMHRGALSSPGLLFLVLALSESHPSCIRVMISPARWYRGQGGSLQNGGPSAERNCKHLFAVDRRKSLTLIGALKIAKGGRRLQVLETKEKPWEPRGPR